jgi:hypothetical protein
MFNLILSPRSSLYSRKLQVLLLRGLRICSSDHDVIRRAKVLECSRALSTEYRTRTFDVQSGVPLTNSGHFTLQHALLLRPRTPEDLRQLCTGITYFDPLELFEGPSIGEYGRARGNSFTALWFVSTIHPPLAHIAQRQWCSLLHRGSLTTRLLLEQQRSNAVPSRWRVGSCAYAPPHLGSWSTCIDVGDRPHNQVQSDGAVITRHPLLG